jgi:hypothetical protein
MIYEDNIEKAFEAFDAYNMQDPNQFSWKGENQPQEYFLALALYIWVKKLSPNASEELVLASRAQHIGRWESPRSAYDEGKVGYLKWRKDLSQFHANKACEILEKLNFKIEQINRVKQIILKQQIKSDDEVQTMENALCLVFLEYQYEAFLQKHEPEMMVNILKKSLQKMDSEGHKWALTLPYSTIGMELIQEALKQISFRT